ncbi:hypothetical protein VNO77_23538 [Canavalia gladiata]|uniref:Uncharacterized protein n=1 Tax=Canavalia gladiata TaxID=3824 RepID=A0AAN9QBL4_CANGL
MTLRLGESMRLRAVCDGAKEVAMEEPKISNLAKNKGYYSKVCISYWEENGTRSYCSESSRCHTTSHSIIGVHGHG